MGKTWVSANIRRNLSEKICKNIQDNKDPSITNLNQFLDLAIREKLERLEATQK